MTKSQRNKIEQLKDRFFRFHSYGNPYNYEIKECKVETNKYFVTLVIEVGMKNDEGTLASILARDRQQFFIGKRGGVKVMNKNNRLVSDKFWK